MVKTEEDIGGYLRSYSDIALGDYIKKAINSAQFGIPADCVKGIQDCVDELVRRASAEYTEYMGE